MTPFQARLWADQLEQFQVDWAYSNGWLVVRDGIHVMLARVEFERIADRPWQDAAPTPGE